MGQYDSDGSGIIRVINDQGVVEYDRSTGNTAVNRSGWSTHVASVATRYKNITESTGKADTKHSSTN